MSKETISTVFLAGSTVELISALACIAGLEVREAVVFVERNISFKPAAMDPLLASARHKYPTVRFVELEIERSSIDLNRRPVDSFKWRLQKVRSIRRQIDVACRRDFGLSLKQLGKQVETVYFTALHDYVLVFLAACAKGARVLYPHGFDHPRRQQVNDLAYLVARRSATTAVTTLARQKRTFGLGGILIGLSRFLLPGSPLLELPFTGVDLVLTFRSGIDFVPNRVQKVPGLAEIFRWLLQLPSWASTIEERSSRPKGSSLLLLLNEVNRNPIWEVNRNYGLSHLKLLQAVLQKFGAKRVVLKAHVRSDGSAAEWLAEFLAFQAKDWQVEVLPLPLSGLPVEALALTEEFAAACSLGSCSLPPGLDFGIPHYVSLAAAALFDQGWVGDPFWMNYAETDRLLIDEGICINIDSMVDLRQSDVRSRSDTGGKCGKA